MVLEVGCGTGRISREITAKKANLTVLDIGERLVRQVKEKLNCNGVSGNACDLPFEDNSFDLVISSECIEHTMNPGKAIREMCRVCRKGGIVCITSPNKIWYPLLWLSVKMGIRKFKGTENWLSWRQADSIMRQSKMFDIRRSGCHAWPFQIKFTRPLLKWIDETGGPYLYPILINYGLKGVKG